MDTDKWKQRVLTVIAVLTLTLFSVCSAYAVEAVGVVVNGGEPVPSGGRLLDNTAYVPLESIFEALDVQVVWDVETRMFVLNREDREVRLAFNGPEALLNGVRATIDRASVVTDDALLVPARLVGEGLGLDIHWESESQTVFLTTPQYVAKNGYPYEPDPIIECTENELDLFTHVVFAEAREEPYEGYVAVAAVIINRVESPEFPDSVYDVIMQPGQFAVIANGTVNWEPDDHAKRAVREALTGVDPSNGALFFFDPSRSTKASMFEREVLAEIGSHRFMK